MQCHQTAVSKDENKSRNSTLFLHQGSFNKNVIKLLFKETNKFGFAYKKKCCKDSIFKVSFFYYKNKTKTILHCEYFVF